MDGRPANGGVDVQRETSHGKERICGWLMSGSWVPADVRHHHLVITAREWEEDDRNLTLAIRPGTKLRLR